MIVPKLYVADSKFFSQRTSRKNRIDWLHNCVIGGFLHLLGDNRLRTEKDEEF
jgi:hypothetical protein